jgi:hypothetical protein
MRRSAIALAASALLSACIMTSASPRIFEPAQRPHGVGGMLRVGSEAYPEVELLTVQDSGYVVLTGNRIAFAPFRFVTEARFRQMGYGVPTDRNRVPVPEMREQLRHVSRFPYGIPTAAMAALLQQARQQAPDTLGLTVRR